MDADNTGVSWVGQADGKRGVGSMAWEQSYSSSTCAPSCIARLDCNCTAVQYCQWLLAGDSACDECSVALLQLQVQCSNSQLNKNHVDSTSLSHAVLQCCKHRFTSCAIQSQDVMFGVQPQIYQAIMSHNGIAHKSTIQCWTSTFLLSTRRYQGPLVDMPVVHNKQWKNWEDNHWRSVLGQRNEYIDNRDC